MLSKDSTEWSLLLSQISSISSAKEAENAYNALQEIQKTGKMLPRYEVFIAICKVFSHVKITTVDELNTTILGKTMFYIERLEADRKRGLTDPSEAIVDALSRFDTLKQILKVFWPDSEDAETIRKAFNDKAMSTIAT